MSKALKIQSNIDQEKVNRDIVFIAQFGKWCLAHGWRQVVYGGYGLDAYLQKITRNHGDIDLVVFGSTARAQAQVKIVEQLNILISDIEINTQDQEFMIDIKVKSSGIIGNLYYVQTAQDPFINLNEVVRSDGSTVVNDEKDFPPPVPGILGSLTVEAQDQSSHLKDILRKRNNVAVVSKHDQDIANIQELLAK